jgi:hypothetical protein
MREFISPIAIWKERKISPKLRQAQYARASTSPKRQPSITIPALCRDG